MDNTARIILHIDMNSYFASVEQQANPFLRGKPIGITGKNQERSVIATASIEAKALGVKTAMSTWEAKKVCPSIILWPGDLEKYSDVMHRFNAIYESFTPHVEPFSVDESFLDITEEAEDYFGATYMAQAIRSRLREDLGERITASIGIAPNNLMAKLACETVKPNGLTVVRPEDCLELLDNSELDDLCGIGPRIKERLNTLGVTNFKQLREFPLEHLEQEFHSYGTWLHEAAWAGVRSPVYGFCSFKAISIKPETGDLTPEAKSYGHSYTLPQNTSDPRVLKRYLFGLADKVGWRMRRDNVVARRVTAFARFGDFSSHGEQRTFQEPTADGMRLFQVAWKILEPISLVDVRLVGLSTSMLSGDPTQPPLFKKERNMTSVLSALDELQSRYGSGVWKRGATLQAEFPGLKAWSGLQAGKSRSSGFHF